MIIAEMANDKIDRMGTAEHASSCCWSSRCPAVAGVLVQMLYNIIDAVYVGARGGDRTAWRPPRWRTPP